MQEFRKQLPQFITFNTAIGWKKLKVHMKGVANGDVASDLDVHFTLGKFTSKTDRYTTLLHHLDYHFRLNVPTLAIHFPDIAQVKVDKFNISSSMVPDNNKTAVHSTLTGSSFSARMSKRSPVTIDKLAIEQEIDYSILKLLKMHYQVSLQKGCMQNESPYCIRNLQAAITLRDFKLLTLKKRYALIHADFAKGSNYIWQHYPLNRGMTLTIAPFHFTDNKGLTQDKFSLVMKKYDSGQGGCIG
ncbi:MAG: hypothetical protein COB66_00330 [Coxiella sp. (in: Bacteria)]|nr:MAG: hypothetical protein COB66_00330 [Coxiella sp. (in: g-proteobacteria)]